MSSRSLNASILKYCDRKQFDETSKCLENIEEKSPVDLEKIFQDIFQEDSSIKKLSFSYKVDNKLSLLKRRIATKNLDQNNVAKSCKSKISKKIKLEKDEESIPESFLLLMDELCIDRVNAQKFFQNPSEWAYVKSDRKIYCTKKGNISHHHFKNNYPVSSHLCISSLSFQDIKNILGLI
jgi:hypothetical protein